MFYSNIWLLKIENKDLNRKRINDKISFFDYLVRSNKELLNVVMMNEMKSGRIKLKIDWNISIWKKSLRWELLQLNWCEYRIGEKKDQFNNLLIIHWKNCSIDPKDWLMFNSKNSNRLFVLFSLHFFVSFVKNKKETKRLKYEFSCSFFNELFKYPNPLKRIDCWSIVCCRIDEKKWMKGEFVSFPLKGRKSLCQLKWAKEWMRETKNWFVVFMRFVLFFNELLIKWNGNSFDQCWINIWEKRRWNWNWFEM